ncbi:MAG: hypothetical protein NC038_05485 [Paludibacter sp.]|nr:hypothetical protein [Bacteroidales bacterium]MCM1069823.1 hypothetical protein [Prevotella sp.]MCM1353983.1 hypothetical protein [Bacteroides sp.]MCM1443375.1 hypothetical protein [Muribaculum sp.]MCM1482078.1 hypothetical protein [Paludibacter sp.]
MDVYGKIAQLIKQMGEPRHLLVFPAEVKQVDGRSCTVSIDSFDLTDVRLRAVVNDEKEQFLITPKQGSRVLVADLSNGDLRDLAVIAFSEVEKIEIDTTAEVIFNGGDNHGLVNIADLHQRLQTLEQAFNSHTHIVNASGTGNMGNPISVSGTAAKITSDSTQFQGNYDAYEDTKVKH